MPRLNKSSKSEVVAPVPQVEVSSTEQTVPEPKKAKRASKAKSSADTVVSEVKNSDPVVENTVLVADSKITSTVQEEFTEQTVDETMEFTEQSVEFLSHLQQLGLLISSLKSEYRVLEKKWSRELKAANKQSLRRKRKTVNRAPSGFVKPTRISDELATFLEKPSGSEMARTEVTRDINKYIRMHNLQDKDNGRKINPDTKLATLLKITGTEELTYFNLQRYMSPHFAKATKEASVSPAVVV
jgi:chromatin remodeling complex protein RSC6